MRLQLFEQLQGEVTIAHAAFHEDVEIEGRGGGTTVRARLRLGFRGSIVGGLLQTKGLFEILLDHLQQLLRPEWFAEIIRHAGLQAVLAVSFQHVGGQGDDGNLSALADHPFRLQFPNGPCRFETVHFRHLAIHEHQIVRLIAERLHRLTAVPHNVEFIAKALQDLRGHLLVDGIVLSQQNPSAGVPRLGDREELRLAREDAPRQHAGVLAARREPHEHVEQIGRYDRFVDETGHPVSQQTGELAGLAERDEQDQGSVTQFGE